MPPGLRQPGHSCPGSSRRPRNFDTPLPISTSSETPSEASARPPGKPRRRGLREHVQNGARTMAVLSWGRASKAGGLLDPTCPEHPQLQPGSPGRRIPAQVPPSGQRAPGGESVGGRPSVGGVKVRGLPAQNTPGKERVRGAARLIRQAPESGRHKGWGAPQEDPSGTCLFAKVKAPQTAASFRRSAQRTAPPRPLGLPPSPPSPTPRGAGPRPSPVLAVLRWVLSTLVFPVASGGVGALQGRLAPLREAQKAGVWGSGITEGRTVPTGQSWPWTHSHPLL